MNSDAAIQHLIDRQAIMDCLTRYCRGVDRFDRELVLSAYHPDAIDDHGAFVGTREEFVAWVFALHQKGQISTQHHLSNHTCDIDGKVAHAETYYIFTARNVDETLWVAGGRYLDRLELRDQHWRIAARYCIVEWSGTFQPGAIPFADIPDVHATGVPGRNKSDPSYLRPLANKRKRRLPND
jgi:SnoaL-like protein